MAAFHTIAEYYEVLSDSEARLRREGPFLAECLERAPGRRVLDVACGTGLHAEFFANLGAEVAALDLSAEMIAHARERRPHPAIHYAAGDMREPPTGPWDLAVCLGNSLSLLEAAGQLAPMFRAVQSALAPGGLFVVQVLNYAAPAAQQPRHRVERRSRGDVDVIAVKSLVPNGDRTLLSIACYSLTQGACSSASETAVLMNVTLEQIRAAAEEAGLAVIGTFGGFDRAAYAADQSQDLVSVLENS